MDPTQPHVTTSSAAAATAIRRPTRPASRKGGASLAIIGGLALIGGLAGTVLGLSRPREYQVSLNAQIDNVLVFPSWEANQATARFSQTLRRSDVKRTAAETSGVDGSQLREIAALSNNDSSLVQVLFITEDADRSSATITTLTDTALRTLAESDRRPDQLLVDQNSQELAALDAQLQAMWTSVAVAPGTDLGSLYNSSKLELEIDRQQLTTAKEQWRIDQLQASISTRGRQVELLQPMLPTWYAADQRRTVLRDLVRPAAERIRTHELGMDLLASGDYRGPVDVTPIGRSTLVGRWAAGGVSLGIAAALGVLALLTMRSARKSGTR